jgi:acetylornithine aminotransferase/acetylornithine/N-succinyldiaminopimelate aminotransferase
MASRGKGVYLYSESGDRYLDFLSGIGVNALGYAHPAITKAIEKKARKLIHTSNLFFTPYQAELAKRLTELSGLDRAFFTNSGTEAWEGALKFARAFARHESGNGNQPAYRVLAMENSFHGRTFGSLATTWTAKYREPFGPLMPGVTFVRFNDVEDLKRNFDATVCAICVETIQGEGGVTAITPEFFAAARGLTKKSGALLLVDEIQCGLGRTGKYFAYQYYGILPDVVTVAKPLAAGIPLGAILTTNAVSECMHPGLHGTTFGGGPLACAVAIAFLETLKREKLLPHITKMGEYAKKNFDALKKKHRSIRDVRCYGLMIGIEVDSADLAKNVAKEMLERKIVINRTHEIVLRMLPPYIIEKKHIDEVAKVLDDVFSKAGK